MGKKFKSIGELEHFLENKVNAALDNGVKKDVIKILEANAQMYVYDEEDVYMPTMYNRRYSLMEDQNYEVDNTQNLKLKITPVARFNPMVSRWSEKSHSYYPSISSNGYGDELAGLINYGDGWNGYEYEFKTDEERENPTYSAPRPFLDETREALVNGGYLGILADSLEEMGIKVK